MSKVIENTEEINVSEMADTKIDVSGEMEVPPASAQGGIKLPFEVTGFPRFQSLPTPIELIKLARRYLRPWTEFFNTANFKTAVSMPRLTSRTIRNLKYFQSNYICIFVVMMIYCLVTSPLILLVLAGAGYASHKIRSAPAPVTICGYTLSTKQQIIALNAAMVPALFLVGAGSALFWTLGASIFLVGIHAVFYNIDAIVTEDTDDFLSEVV